MKNNTKDDSSIKAIVTMEAEVQSQTRICYSVLCKSLT